MRPARWLAVLVLLTGCSAAPELPTVQALPNRPGGYVLSPRPECDERLTAAIQRDETAELRRLVQAGVTPTCGADDTPTALSAAVIRDQIEMVRVLLEAGADPNLRWTSTGDRFPLQEAIQHRQYRADGQLHRAEVVSLLLSNGADPNASWCLFESRVPIYSSEGPPRIVHPGCVAATGVSPLRVAAQGGQADTVALLLKAGARAEHADDDNSLALDWSGTDQVYGLLVAHQFGSEMNAAADYRRRGPTPYYLRGYGSTLSAAVALRLYGFTRLELASGTPADLRTSPSDDAVTPLSAAIAARWHEGVGLLVAHGADLDARSCPPPDWIRFAAGGRTVQMAGCTRDRGLTPLMIAGIAGQPEIAATLAARLPSATDAVDWMGRSARRHAELAGVPRERLHEYGRQ